MEYKYKKGQFLRNKISGNVVKINQDTNMILEEVWEAWAPKPGEWCYFLEDKDSKYPILAKYSCMINSTRYSTEFGDECYDLCEPYTKNLPFGLK